MNLRRWWRDRKRYVYICEDHSLRFRCNIEKVRDEFALDHQKTFHPSKE